MSEYSVFHDESGDYGHGNWVFTGLFWIKNDKIDEITSDLLMAREKEDYFGEIHFKQFPKKFEGKYGSKARVGKDWFNIWLRKWADKTFFNVLSIDRKSLRYEHDRFSKDFHAYNRFVGMSILGGITWFFDKFQKIELDMYSDGKDRRPEGLEPDGISTDNFEEYVKKRVFVDTDLRNKCSNLNLRDVECLSCGKSGPYSPQEELLQLTDLLLGAVSTAIEPKSKKETRKWFAKKVAKLMKDVRLEPWNQSFGLHKKFSVSYFPNNKSKVYTSGPIGILEQETKKLFSESGEFLWKK